MIMESRIMKIRAKRQALDAQALKEQNERDEIVRNYANAIIELAPRIKDLMEIAQALVENKIPLGKKWLEHGCFDREEFLAEGINHRIGFFPVYNQGRRALIGVGIMGGGCCGHDLAVNENGIIVTNPLSMVVGTWSYRDAYFDYCDKCKRFLESFDAFESRVNEYVDNL